VAELAFLIEQAIAQEAPDVLPLLPPHVLIRRSMPARLAIDSADGAHDVQAATPTAPLPTIAAAKQALESESGSVSRAASRLGISRFQLHRLIRRHQISIGEIPS
jgi:transcriptional regulator of acetoin/glycerol metabolism